MDDPKRPSQYRPEVGRAGPRFSAQHPGEDYGYNERRPSNSPAQEYQRQSTSPPHFTQPLNRTSEHATAPTEDSPEPCFARTDEPLPPSPKAPYIEAYSPGLQSVHQRESEKEVHRKDYPVTHVALDMPHHEQPILQTQPPDDRQRKRICGVSILWFLLLVALIACAVIAVAAACGVVFGTKKK